MDIQYFVPKQSDHKHLFTKTNTLLPFSRSVVEFVNQFSSTIVTDPALKTYKELVALGFWMRKSAIQNYQKTFDIKNKGKIKLARGTVFHIAPANVDTIFIYSLFISLLMGNSNIVRLSTQAGQQTELLIHVLNDVLDERRFAHLQDQVQIVSFEHNTEILEKISAISDARVIWGGDDSIERISRIPISPKAIDIKFANKLSFTILNGKQIESLPEKEMDSLAIKFLNDSYSFAQMACSSPRFVIWMNGTEVGQKRFWCAIEKRLDSYEHQLTDSDIINKMVYSYSLAIEKKIRFRSTRSNYLTILRTDLKTAFQSYSHCGSGLFLESNIDNLDSLLPFLNRDFQTVSYYGFERNVLIDWVSNNLNGIDRIVPVGQALDFYPVWDGFDLSEMLTREVTVL